MEQHTQGTVSPEIDASATIDVTPEPNIPHLRQRCRARRRDRKQCRLFAQDPATGLCPRHAAYAEPPEQLQDTTDLSKQLLVVNEGGYCSTESVNAILSNVVELLAKGRISPRRASVITFALSLLLRSVIVVDRQVANTPPQINWGSSWPSTNRDHTPAPESAHADAVSSPDAHPQSSHEAMENYARLRT
jgi:hypothetical protein